MTTYSISAAARIIDRGRATVARHMASGKLSFTLDEQGNRIVDGSELARVYGDRCDFQREEDRKKGSKTIRSESKPNRDETALHTAHERLIEQYQAQVEHLQQALATAQEGQDRVTLLLEDRSAQKEQWQATIDALTTKLTSRTEQQISQQVTELKAAHGNEIRQLKRALHAERNKTFWDHFFGRPPRPTALIEDTKDARSKKRTRRIQEG